MKWFDRLVVIGLAMGIWALVLNPLPLTAHPNDIQKCSGSGTGHGERDGGEVFVYSLDLDIQCKHI